jgi:hypothetical protein
MLQLMNMEQIHLQCIIQLFDQTIQHFEFLIHIFLMKILPSLTHYVAKQIAILLTLTISNKC